MAARQWSTFFLPLPALLRHAFALFIMYRVNIYIWMIAGALPLLVMLIWVQIAEKSMGSILSAEFAYGYFSTIFLTRQLTQIWVSDILAQQIQDGELAPRLLRPAHPYCDHLARHLAGVLIRLPVALVVTILIVLVSGAAAEMDLALLPVFAVSVLLAWLILFNVMFAVGLLAFWTSQVRSVTVLVSTMATLLGGAVAPFVLMPHWITDIAKMTPFPWAISFPVSVLVHRSRFVDVSTGILIEGAWAAAAVLVVVILWKNGVRRYTSFGG